MYKQIINKFETEVRNDAIIRLSDNAFIPFDPANTDAQQFAKWLQDGNRPEPAEEGGSVTDEWIAETINKLLPNG
jgi:hypothetical protein